MLGLLFLSIAIGFFLGRRFSSKTENEQQSSSFDKKYFKGLHLLLNEQPDAAIDTFIDSLEVNSETLEMHLALGNMLRRQGEVDRAIRIHQNLLARPGLSQSQQHHAQLELARDYVKAVLLDRAERLFKELVEQSDVLSNVCLEHLVEIYRDEKEWEKAIDAVDHLVGKRLSKVPIKWRSAQAHFCCELAETALDKNDYLRARRHLKSALNYDKNSVRASLLWGQLEYQLGNSREALKILKKIPQQDPDYIVEALPMFAKCYHQMNDVVGFRQWLMHLQEHFPSSSLVIEITKHIQQEEGDEVAAKYIGGQLKERPSLQGLSQLLDFYLANSSEKTQESLTILKQLIDELIEKKMAYQCQQCGFTGNQLHWLCPSCKSWNTIKAIRGIEGE